MIPKLPASENLANVSEIKPIFKRLRADGTLDIRDPYQRNAPPAKAKKKRK